MANKIKRGTSSNIVEDVNLHVSEQFALPIKDVFTEDEIGSLSLGGSGRLKFKNSSGNVMEVANIDDLNQIMKYGATSVVMNGTDTIFNIQHNMGSIPTSFGITFGDASNENFVQSVRTLTSTDIVITCANAPTAGSQIVYWQVYK